MMNSIQTNQADQPKKMNLQDVVKQHLATKKSLLSSEHSNVCGLQGTKKMMSQRRRVGAE
jgi:hypothetical protein